MKRMILASGSPRRRELMAQAGFQFEIQTSDKEENYHSSKPDEIVKELALLKARDVAEQNQRENLLVIGADTVVSLEERILGKPASKEEAYAMIRSLSGRAHQVYTGVAVLDYDEEGREQVLSHAVCTEVYVSEMTEEEIREYVETEEVMDKAGAYAIQGTFGVKYVERFEGDYFNVVGLPISYLYQVLKERV